MADTGCASPTDYSLVELEYETQLFGYSPKALLDTLAGTLDQDDCVRRALADTFKRMRVDVDEEKLDELVAAALTDTAHWDNFEKLQDYLCAEVVRVPHTVVLPEDRVHSVNDDDKAGRRRRARLLLAALRRLVQVCQAREYKLELQQKIATAQHQMDQLKRIKQIHDSVVKQ